MPIRFAPLLRAAGLAGLLALAACSGGDDDNIAAIDNALIGNDADPALTSALEDQILVDPNLVQQAHPNTVRPPEMPAQAQYPAGSAQNGSRPAPAQSQARVQNASTSTGQASADRGDCGDSDDFQYGPEWANRLPAGFPAYPGGRVTEAAGTSASGCRVVTFRTGDPYQRVLDFYRNVATRAGFSAEHQVRGADHVLGGVNQRTDGAYYLIVTPLQNGSDVALIVNNGR